MATVEKPRPSFQNHHRMIVEFVERYLGESGTARINDVVRKVFDDFALLAPLPSDSPTGRLYQLAQRHCQMALTAAEIRAGKRAEPIEDLLWTLPLNQATALRLTIVEGHDVAEAAALMGMAEAAVSELVSSWRQPVAA